MVDFAKLDRAFSPRYVAVIGDSWQTDFGHLRRQSSFRGRLYSVQPQPELIKGITALGISNHCSLLDIVEPIDLAIVAVPMEAASGILEDCIRKEVAAAHFPMLRSAESRTGEETKFEQRVMKRVEEANFLIIGPSCAGVFNPKVGIRQSEEQYSGSSGPVGLISQSDSQAIGFSLEAHTEGVDISKSVSVGAGVLLDVTDYLEYFTGDPEVRAIGIYLERIDDGRKFLRVLKDASSVKPVVVWIGARTEAGRRNIAPGARGQVISEAVCGAALRQCGATSVGGMEELIDTIKALLYLPPVRGNRVAVAGGSGGQSVAIADAFAEAGLKLPRLTQESYDRLSSFYNLIGGGYRNPVDTGNQNRSHMERIMEILERDANIDNVVLLASFRWASPEQLRSQLRLMTTLRERTVKPLAVIASYYTPEEMRRTIDLARDFQAQGIPVFPSIERGARALKNALDYYSLKGSIVG